MRRLSLFAAFLVLTLCMGCGKQSATGVSVASRFTPAVPPDTHVLAQLDLTRLKTSAFYARHRKDLDIPLLNAAAERLGFDPRRDLSAILFAQTGQQYLVLAAGTLDAKTIAPKLAALGGRQRVYRGATFVDNGAESAAFLSSGLAVIGPPAIVRAGVGRSASGSSHLPQQFNPLLAVLPRNSQLWLASLDGLPFTGLISRSDIRSALSNITPDIAQTAAGVTFQSGAQLEIDLLCFRGASQGRVYDGLRAGLALARLTSQNQDADLAQLYRSIQVEEDGNNVRLSADLTPAQTDELLARALNFRLR